MQDHKTKYKIQMINSTKFKLTTPPLFPIGILQKEYCTIFQYPDGCNADQWSLILATRHTHKQKWAVNMTCHYLLLIPDPDPSLNCWGGNPYCLVLFSGFKSNWYVDNDVMKHLSSKPHTVVPWWPFCTAKQRLMPNALHSWLNTTLPASKYLKCFPSFISVEGHTDWITVTVLMCELQVSVTSCSGHNDLNEN